MHLGAQELIVILLIVLILFGGKKVAGLGKALGTSLREFKEEVNKSSSEDGTNTHAVQVKSDEKKETAASVDADGEKEKTK